MKSLAVRILIYLGLCLAFAVLVLVYWADLDFRSHGPLQFYQETLQLFANQAEKHWLNHDIKNLEALFAELDEHYHSRFQLLDKFGTDVLGFDDHPELIEEVHREEENERVVMKSHDRFKPPHRGRNRKMAFVGPTSSHNFYMIQWVEMPPPRIPPPLFLFIALILSLFGWLMNKQVAVPVRNLKMILERFGQGELTVRSEIDRKDEIGQLASSFNQMADQVSSLVEQERTVVRSVAHEVRGPLTRINLLIERVRSGKRLPETLDRLESEIKSLSQMPDILLRLSMVENGQAKIMKLPLAIERYLESEIQKMNLQAELRKCKFNFQCLSPKSDSWTIETDESILSRCLENIIDNALRHSSADSVIDVTLNKNTDGYEITVRDYGSGVPEKDIHSIFRPFFRSDASRNRHTGGLGLGLAITRSGIQSLGGKVWAENSNPGLRVILSLPEK